MENITIGSLLRVTNNTYGWKGREDHRLLAGDLVVLCDLNTEAVVGLPTFGVLHGKFGKLTCLAMDFRKVENRSQQHYN